MAQQQHTSLVDTDPTARRPGGRPRPPFMRFRLRLSFAALGWKAPLDLWVAHAVFIHQQQGKFLYFPRVVMGLYNLDHNFPRKLDLINECLFGGKFGST